MLVYLQAMQVTVTGKGRDQEVQEVKERKSTRIKFKVMFYILTRHYI